MIIKHTKIIDGKIVAPAFIIRLHTDQIIGFSEQEEPQNGDVVFADDSLWEFRDETGHGSAPMPYWANKKTCKKVIALHNHIPIESIQMTLQVAVNQFKKYLPIPVLVECEEVYIEPKGIHSNRGVFVNQVKFIGEFVNIIFPMQPAQKTYTQEQVDDLLDRNTAEITNLMLKKLYDRMDMCRAYNAGKQNMIDVHQKGETAFISSDTYVNKVNIEENKISNY